MTSPPKSGTAREPQDNSAIPTAEGDLQRAMDAMFLALEPPGIGDFLQTRLKAARAFLSALRPSPASISIAGGGVGVEEAVEAVAAALEPKCRGFGHGNMPKAIAREFAETAVAALFPTPPQPTTQQASGDEK